MSRRIIGMLIVWPRGLGAAAAHDVRVVWGSILGIRKGYWLQCSSVLLLVSFVVQKI